MTQDSSHPFAHGPANRSMPAATVLPVLHYPDVLAAATWLCGAFGFRERLRIGDHRVQMAVGAGAFVIAQGTGDACAVMVRVADADRHHAQARDFGARILGEPQSQPYGERQYSAVDLAGHVWTFSQTEANVDPATWGGTLVQDPASSDITQEKP